MRFRRNKRNPLIRWTSAAASAVVTNKVLQRATIPGLLLTAGVGGTLWYRRRQQPR